jgi:hypothetical protein
MAMSVTSVGRGAGGSGCKFLPLYTSTLLLDRVSQKCEYFLWFSMETLTYPGFSKTFFSYNQIKSQLLYNIR